MPYKVFLTQDAERDLEDLHEFVFQNDSPMNAEQLLDKIETALEKLADFPERGNHPKELVSCPINSLKNAVDGIDDLIG